MGLAALALYLALAPPVSGDQDSSEFALALATGGVPHPTGYPLYAMGGHAFCVFAHALGATWPYAANAWSALGGGVAVGLFHALASRAAPNSPGLGRRGRSLAALAAVAMAGLNPMWTYSAALAEVHSWHLAWVAGLCLLFVTHSRGIAASDSRTGDVPSAAVWGFACGLGLAHHVTAVLFAVPLSVVLAVGLVRARRWRPRLALAALAAALVPLASYGFVAYRSLHPALFQSPLLEPGVRGFVRHVTGGTYGNFLGHFESDLQRGFLAADIYPFLFPGLAALLLIALRARRPGDRSCWWGLLAASAAQTAFTFTYGVPDPAVYFLPALWTGLLAVPVLLAAARGRRALHRVLAVVLVLGVAALSAPWLRVALERRHAFVTVDQHLRRVWRGIPFERGIVLWPSDMYCRLREYQIYDGEHPDRFVTNPVLFNFPGPRRDFTRRFGFDPLPGLVLRGKESVALIPPNMSRRTAALEEYIALIPANINRRTALPVALLDPIGFTATVLEKGGP